VEPTFSAALASLDGEIMLASAARIPATDDGFIRGDGVFEVMRLYDGVPFALEEHLKRMERSAGNLRLPLDLEAVRTDMARLLVHAGSGPDHALLRIVVTRGGRRLLITESMPPLPDQTRLGSVTYSPTLILDGVKSLSYAANMLASRLARERGFDEALLVTPEGCVLEAPTSSIFWVKDDQVFTPPLDEHILASITRALIIAETGATERSCTLDEIKDADEAFIASTAREVQPVSAIDEHALNAPGPVTENLIAAVAARIRAELSRLEEGWRPRGGSSALGTSA
jgi:branched-chain amino acid aminotransferase